MEEYFNNFLSYAKALFQVWMKQIELFKLEATLAKKSVMPLLLYGFMSVIIGILLWVSFELLLGFAILKISHSVAISLTSLFLLNLSIFIFLLKIIKGYYANISFSRTRNLINNQQSEKQYNEQQ